MSSQPVRQSSITYLKISICNCPRILHKRKIIYDNTLGNESFGNEAPLKWNHWH